MKLIGSKPSPYVRRLRLYLAGEDYQYEELDIMQQAGRSSLRQHTPAMKIPVLVDHERTIYDSRVIFNYLNQKLNKAPLNWEQENNLTLIDAVNDSLVIMIMLTRSGIDNRQDILIANLQRERISETLALLDEKCEAGEFGDWNYPAMCLYCLLDWLQFRELYDISGYAHLLQFLQAHAKQAGVEQSDPR